MFYTLQSTSDMSSNLSLMVAHENVFEKIDVKPEFRGHDWYTFQNTFDMSANQFSS